MKVENIDKNIDENIDENNKYKDYMKIYKNFFSTSTFLEDLVKVCEEKNAKIYCGSKLVYKFDKNNTPVDNEK